MFHVKPDTLPADLAQRLDRFAEILTRWNSRINLVSPRDLPHLWDRHIADSLQLASLIPPGIRLADLGSGGGFPGLIIAIATDADVTLIESDQRKAAFLREAARAAGARVTVLARRIEDVDIAPVHIVTARALAALPQLLEWSSRLLAPDGFCLFLKGRNVDDELTSAAADWHMAVSRLPSRTNADGTILKLGEITRARHSERATGP
ncbi:16S rRNA (guanine(527)-N(7))-methyltransferase RsmG [Gluconacetobacter takamatsuzukensis]|uniref:Ribosomal RNA small subunit methyltransferase G n=1 Tax=Gluconacetobacter takamatsuzukensis TaxID=1286190 RepID=A0A7W4KC38_9PROT|nr:16S rRNA (guanine(527)-N(7))-methyltransferase RsmG [Gluconacetobacter takamatsuzukensis]MBB2204193.1 16S rRNA (guanine(527)-N(7))-methyltransferase RsmG [Gluconacetobacter takamatsuzukensis]